MCIVSEDFLSERRFTGVGSWGVGGLGRAVAMAGKKERRDKAYDFMLLYFIMVQVNRFYFTLGSGGRS